MEYYQVTLNEMDIELRRVNDAQLDTVRRNNPHNIAVNAEWRRRQPRPPPTAREIEMEANRAMVAEASNSVGIRLLRKRNSRKYRRHEAGILRGDRQVRGGRKFLVPPAPASERRAVECRGEC